MLHDTYNNSIDTVDLWDTMATDVRVQQTASLSKYSCVKLLVPTYSGVHKSQAPVHSGD
jgi:hypothetical protein